MKQYKNTGVWLSPGSACAKALAEGKPKVAEAIFKQTEVGFIRDVPNAEDRAWLMSASKHGLEAKL